MLLSLCSLPPGGAPAGSLTRLTQPPPGAGLAASTLRERPAHGRSHIPSPGRAAEQSRAVQLPDLLGWAAGAPTLCLPPGTTFRRDRAASEAAGSFAVDSLAAFICLGSRYDGGGAPSNGRWHVSRRLYADGEETSRPSPEMCHLGHLCEDAHGWLLSTGGRDRPLPRVSNTPNSGWRLWRVSPLSWSPWVWEIGGGVLFDDLVSGVTGL